VACRETQSAAIVTLELNAGPCRLRPWRPGDEHALARHANDHRVWRTLRDDFPYPYTLRDAETWVRHAAALPPLQEMAVAVEGEPVGGIGIVPQRDVHRRTAELGYWLGAELWGRGIMTAAVRSFAAAVFERRDFGRLQALVFASNPASARVLEKAGWTREGVLRRHVLKEGGLTDAIVYAALRGP
jgi:RimJ/RimL family protein N-acetyltransferase